MFCPNCKCEYIRGVTECPDCGVPLVEALDPPAEAPPEDVRLVALWQGSELGEYEKIIEALEKAGIRFMVPDSRGRFGFLANEPRLEIWTSDEDQERAKKVLLELEVRVDPDELTPEETGSLALPESDGPDSDGEKSHPENFTEDWHEDDPVAEVWTGDSESFVDALIACLREVGIESHKVSEAGRFRLVVRPEEDARAKEVVREVVEASPPE